MGVRNLVLVLGDQLDRTSATMRRAQKSKDVIVMAEVHKESAKVWSHKARTTMFLSAMRHHAQWLTDSGWTVDYSQLGEHECLSDAFAAAIAKHEPECILALEPGAHEVREMLDDLADSHEISFEILPDDHFLTSPADFAQWAKGRKQLTMEYFYRDVRKRFEFLTDDGEPVGGKWNFDEKNRSSFGQDGPPDDLPKAPCFAPDSITQDVITDVEKHFDNHPGSLEHFDWPVTREDALESMNDFVSHRLSLFGKYQDAMWTDEPYLYHSRLSAALNLKLLSPQEVIEAAISAYDDDLAPLEAVEGFIRQIAGWREFVRGLYFHFGKKWHSYNALDAHRDLPDLFWSGETDMTCLRQTVQQTLDYGYAHHIQRLMVTGLFAMLYGVDPQQIHQWYLAVYVDAVEWVEIPNTVGMSQFADGGIMGTKPYAASGNYINKMSNYCRNCRFNYRNASGDNACPFTTLYYDFLDRNRPTLASNRRLKFSYNNLDRKDDEEMTAIRQQAGALKKSLP